MQKDLSQPTKVSKHTQCDYHYSRTVHSIATKAKIIKDVLTVLQK